MNKAYKSKYLQAHEEPHSSSAVIKYAVDFITKTIESERERVIGDYNDDVGLAIDSIRSVCDGTLHPMIDEDSERLEMALEYCDDALKLLDKLKKK